VLGEGEGSLACAAGCAVYRSAGADVTRATAAGGAGGAGAAGAAGEFAASALRADGPAAGTVEALAAGELAAAGVAGAAPPPPNGLPWLGRTVNTTAAAAAATTTSVIAPAIMPVRKLTSSSCALTAARTPGQVPAAV
jgi:hypothetical protein